MSNIFSNKHLFVVNRKLQMKIEVASMRFMSLNTLFFGMFFMANFLVRILVPLKDFVQLVGIFNTFYVCFFCLTKEQINYNIICIIRLYFFS